MRSGRISAGALAIVCLIAAPADAAQKNKPSKPPKTHTASKPKPKADTAKRDTAKGRTATADTARRTTNTVSTDAVAKSIETRPWLVSRIEPLLPRGSSIASASSGFRNEGQFLAALHVSRNLGIPFPTLKKAVTGADAVSLGQAIHVMRPSLDASAEANRAAQQATSDLRQ
jgi:hypothetical protein